MKSYDIVFISPSFAPVLKEESIGTLILAKKAKLAGYNVDVLRYWESNNFSMSNYLGFRENFVELILQKDPTIVSFYCRCTDYHVNVDLAKHIKDRSPNIKIVFGGPQSELVSIQTLRNFEFIDYVACSEGENTIVPLINCIINKNDHQDSIPGLCYRKDNGDIVQNKFPQLLPNDYKREYMYYDLIPSYIVRNSKSLTIDVGRGCPYSCTFCSTKTFWKQQFRLRDIDDMIKEMKWLVLNYGISKFDFDHDMFTVNKGKLRRFCDAIKKNGLSIRWYCSSRLDTIAPQDIDYMYDAGMTNILYGVETGSQRMQKIINKNLNLSKSREIVKYTVAKGIKAKMSFMYGFPEETEADFEETLRLMFDFLKLGAHIVVWRCGILNGTAMYEKHKGELFLSDYDWKNYSFFGYKENKSMVKDWPEVFPQFYDHPNPLRKRLIYFDLFVSLWKDFSRNEFDKIANSFLETGRRLLDLYDIFVASNKTLLTGYTPVSLDKYWNFSENECRILIENFVNYVKSNHLKK